ncbi:neuroligin-4, Y-linked-like [Sitophilus oryzae]|uniref:Neuroligin-4, Y-linked-like n=1 Tax=Sitophilus oryzae TaxID=7048 RepID=A0A6J2XCY3_SITOR|nr:neuroligin-4, Y-linked-like [Sitophilus oryzae]
MLPRCAAYGSRRNIPPFYISSSSASVAARHRVLFLVVFVVILSSTRGETETGPPRYSSRIVEIQTGAIRGIILELNSRHLEPVEVFRGVPYAAPPVGPLRFQPPQAPVSWPGTRLADTFGAVCPQKYPDITNKTAALQFMPKGRYQYLKKLLPLLANQSEDCLFLNIYVPGSGNRGLEAPYAVLVFVHGESFEWGAGHPYDGSVLASYGHVIVVTLNFRLGVLGFLRTKSSADPNSADSGNLGVKDVTAALQWVKINIGAFGGDPTRVTLVGHDTGAGIANLLFLSPTSKGLFRRIILLSGSALSPWATAHNADSLRLTVGKQMGCLPQDSKGDDREDIAACLRSRPLQAILDVYLDSVRFMPRIAPSLPLDNDSTDPAYAMEHASETFITCEVMLGITTTESYADFNANDIQYGFEQDQRNRVLRTYIRNTYVYHLNEIFSAVRNEYTDWDKPIPHPINIRDSTMEALSDGHTVAPLVRVAYLHARRGAKTYFFHFGYQTKESDYPQRLGSVRGEDLTYILGQPLVAGLPFFPQNYSRQDMGVSEALLNFVSNFAKTGDPNVPGIHKEVPDYGTPREKTRYRGLTWDPYEIGTQYYLSITLKPKMKSHYRGHKMAVWLNLIPQLHQPGDEDVNMRHHHFYEREPHYYAGAVRAESFTRLPPVMHPASMTDSQIIGGIGGGISSVNTECVPQTTSDEGLDTGDDMDIDDDEESEELLERLATRHYYSYTAALGVTVGVGCLLLVLNMLIFAGIYYQRDRDRRRHDRTNNHGTSNRLSTNSTPSTDETIPMSQRPSTPGSSARQSPLLGRRDHELMEIPQCYNTIPRSQNPHEFHAPGPASATNTLKKEKPPPPVRTTSNPATSSGTVKKRVQIQEISV